MSKQIPVVPFPNGTESDNFIAALSNAVMPCLGIIKEIPYFCSQKGTYCVKCSDCDTLKKHQEMLYHTLMKDSGLAFTFDYPEDDCVGFHTLPRVKTGWRWEEPFVSDLMDFTGLSYERYTDKSAGEMSQRIKKAINDGCTAITANTRNQMWPDKMEWARCWNVVCGYTDDGITLMQTGGKMITETNAVFHDWIVITGRTLRKMTYMDSLMRIYRVLNDLSHDRLEQEIYSDLSDVMPKNAVDLAFKMMGINGVPIESRWHAAEAFCSSDNLLSSLSADESVKVHLKELFFSRYTANNNGETHGTGRKIWNLLQVGPETGYMPVKNHLS